MSQPTRFTRVFMFLLLAALLLLAVSIGLSSYFGEHAHHGSLMMFDDDMSDSAVAWFVAIPIVLVVLAITALIIIGALMLTLLAVLVAVVFGLFAAVVGVALTLLPLVIILAFPVLAIYGFVKLMQRNNHPPAVV